MGRPPPGQGGWGTDWRWWFQYGTQAVVET